MNQLNQSARQSPFIAVPPPLESMGFVDPLHLDHGDDPKASSGGTSLVEDRTPMSQYNNICTSRPFSLQISMGNIEFTHDVPPAMLGAFTFVSTLASALHFLAVPPILSSKCHTHSYYPTRMRSYNAFTGIMRAHGRMSLDACVSAQCQLIERPAINLL